LKTGIMKTKVFCPACEQILESLTAALRQLFDVCSKITAVVEKEGRTDSPNLEELLSRSRELMAECAAIRQNLQDHRASGHAVSSSFTAVTGLNRR
jgi:hypothetical protein